MSTAALMDVAKASARVRDALEGLEGAVSSGAAPARVARVAERLEEAAYGLAEAADTLTDLANVVAGAMVSEASR